MKMEKFIAHQRRNLTFCCYCIKDSNTIHSLDIYHCSCFFHINPVRIGRRQLNNHVCTIPSCSLTTACSIMNKNMVTISLHGIWFTGEGSIPRLGTALCSINTHSCQWLARFSLATGNMIMFFLPTWRKKGNIKHLSKSNKHQHGARLGVCTTSLFCIIDDRAAATSNSQWNAFSYYTTIITQGMHSKVQDKFAGDRRLGCHVILYTDFYLHLAVRTITWHDY